MQRVHLFEFLDQPWLPNPVRRLGTDYLCTVADRLRLYTPVAPVLADLLAHARQPRIVDLGAGGGGPWRHLLPALQTLRGDATVVLCDLNPSTDSLAEAAADLGGAATAVVEPVDATAVPASLSGVRALFAMLHHLPPDQAQSVLAAAVQSGEPIIVCEATERTLPAMAGMLFGIPVGVLFITPLVRPRTLSRLLLTYVLPVASVLIGWDGFVSCLRTYTTEELDAMAARADPEGRYVWQHGRGRVGLAFVTWFTGRPA